MTRRAGVALLTGIIVAVIFAALATSGDVRFAERGPSFGGASTTEPPVATTTPPTTTDVQSTEQAPWRLPHFVDLVLRAVFFTCITVLAILVLRYAWRHRWQLHWRPGHRRRSAHFQVLEDVAAVIGADADAQRAALRRGTPRNAIVECWLRVEQAVVAAGVPIDPADTSTELTMRVLTTLDVDQAAIERLAALYREARFSDHPMGEDARSAAIDALDAIHDGLRSGRDSVVATA